MNHCKRQGSCCNAIAHAVYRAWAAQGITVIAHDSQGHGRSKGDEPKKHVWMDNFQRWVDDVYQVRKVYVHFKLLGIHLRGEDAAVSALAHTSSPYLYSTYGVGALDRQRQVACSHCCTS